MPEKDVEMKKLRDLVKEYGVPLSDAEDALRDEGFVAVHADIDVYGNTLERYRNVLKNLEKKSKHRISDKTAEHQSSLPSGKPFQTKDYLARDYIIFTKSALRKKGFEQIINDFLQKKIRWKSGSKIVVLNECINIIKNKNVASNYEILVKLIENKFIILLSGSIFDEDKIISEFINKEYRNSSIIVFGQNESLSLRIRNINEKIMNNSGNVRLPIILEREFDSEGNIMSPKINAVFFETKNKPKASLSSKASEYNAEIPELNGFVFRKDKSRLKVIRLLNKSGAEGAIYDVGIPNKCAKILNNKSCSEMKTRKISLMCSKLQDLYNSNPFIMDRIAWPEEIIFDRHGKIIGYIMKYFQNTTPFSYYNNESYPKIVPGLKKIDQVKMAKSFAEIISFMHSHNVILCDINSGNLLFDKNRQAYLVDLDSAQIADKDFIYPSNVGKPEFLSPEHISDKNKFSFIHKKADDVWILQTLIFSILTPAGLPYLTTKADSDEQAVKNGYYPFQAGKNHAEEVAGEKGGRWHIIVGHFPFFLKCDFWDSFHFEGRYFKETNRMSASDWLNDMLRYETDLPNMIKKDPESGEYIPSRSKLNFSAENQQGKKPDLWGLAKKAEQGR